MKIKLCPNTYSFVPNNFIERFLNFFLLLSSGSSCFLQLFPGFSLVSDRRGELGGLGGKAESACEKFEDNEGDILV